MFLVHYEAAGELEECLGHGVLVRVGHVHLQLVPCNQDGENLHPTHAPATIYREETEVVQTIGMTSALVIIMYVCKSS